MNAQQPATSQRQLAENKYKIARGNLLLMIVFTIPVVGFIVIIVLACGAAANKNIRNFALAYVLVWVICIALGILLALVAMPFIMELVNELQYMF